MAAKPNDDSSLAVHEKARQATPVCGIIMPISGSEDYTDEHWRRVQRILTRSVERAGMTPRLVWENAELDVIHARILQSIYESDVALVDVSSLNPNVMLELGLRLSTKKPTVVVTDGVKKPPFDISNFQYHPYQRDLEYNAVDKFIVEIAERLKVVHSAAKDNRYKSFVENFTFEVVEPKEVSVPAEEALLERLSSLSLQMGRLEKRMLSRSVNPTAPGPTFTVSAPLFSTSDADALQDLLRGHRNILNASVSMGSGFGDSEVVVTAMPDVSPSALRELREWVMSAAKKASEVPF